MFLNKNFLKSITKCLVIILLINTCVETKSLNAAAYSCDSSNPPSNCNLSDLFYYMSGATPSNHNVVHDNILFEGHIPSLSSFQSNYCRYMTEKRSDGSGITSLMSAASRGLTNAAQALVNCNANLNDQDTKHDKRAIDYAKQNGHDDIVAVLKDTERFPLNHSCIYDLDCDNTGNNAGVSCGDSSLCCMPNGKACSDTGDCCDGSCNNGICCDAVGKSCQSSVECCNQNCQNGRCCISSAAGQPKCTSSADCCSGLSCDSDTGICADPSSCIAKGATCIPGDLSRAKKVNATSSCCGGLVCKPNNIYSGATLDSTDTCCVDLGVTCNISADCCGQSACQGSACCIPTGQNGCENDNDCCSGNTCQDKGPGHPKQCKLNCKPKDAVCTGDTECCTPMTCNLDPTDNTNTRKICGTKSGCVDNGTVCNLDSDCCKGLCNADPKDSTAKSCQCINDSTTTCNANNCCYGKTCATSNDGKTNNVCCISSANDTKCTDSSDCCSGLTCQAGKCTTGGGDSGGLSGLAIGGIITAACLFVAGAGIYFVFFRKGKKVTSKEPLTERLIVQAAADANMSVDDFVSKLRSGFGQAEFVAISGAIRSYGNADNPDEWVRELITAVLESAPGKIVNLGGSRTSMTIKVTVDGEEGGSGGARLTVRNSSTA